MVLLVFIFLILFAAFCQYPIKMMMMMMIRFVWQLQRVRQELMTMMIQWQIISLENTSCLVISLTLFGVNLYNNVASYMDICVRCFYASSELYVASVPGSEHLQLSLIKPRVKLHQTPAVQVAVLKQYRKHYTPP